MAILSLHGGHNASASIIRDEKGKIKCWCIESERIDRIKMSCVCDRYTGDDFSPKKKSEWILSKKTDFSNLIQHIMDESGVTYEEIDKIVLSQNTDIKRLPYKFLYKPIEYVSHHKAHAALAYYTSKFDDALVIVCDGSGEKVDDGYETQSAWSCSGSKIEKIMGTYKKNTYNMGIGNAYELYTYWLGYGYNGCGTTMALASFDEECGKYDKGIFQFSTNGDVFLNKQFVDVESHVKKIGYVKKGTMAYNQEHEKAMRSIELPRGYRLRNYNDNSVQKEFIIMASDIQHATEKAVTYYLDFAHKKKTMHKSVCLAGGVFLNCNLNSKIREEEWVDDIYVPTAPGDGGLSLGGALSVYFASHERCPIYQTEYIGTKIKKLSLENRDDICAKVYDNIYEETAKQLAEGKIVGWCQGRAEFGPRALGHRSLLADPSKQDIPMYINNKLKHREAFRPFAPSVLEEKYYEYFEGEMPIPYMLETRKIRDAKIAEIPAVCHIDRSARVQVVSKDNCKELYCLLKEFDKITNIPVLLNTSLNRNGEPIVDSAEDAAKLLSKGMIDLLVIDDTMYFRNPDY